MKVNGLADVLRQAGTVHLVGIGGAGMAGLGVLLQARGATVSGCDRESGPALADLERRGIDIEIGHSSEHVAGCGAVVYTPAVPSDHPELEAARRRGVPVIKRSQALADLVNEGRLIAISGTHGKTTTTALTALLLEAAGLDPTALVGGRVPAWGGNARVGRGDTYVVEADEYDRSFLLLKPSLAVVTSVEAEHFDTYANIEEVETVFDSFVDLVPEGGRVVACVDDPGARRRLERAGDRGLGYGLRGEAHLRADAITYRPEGTRFSVHYGDASLGEFELALQGEHNVRNALAGLGVVLALGLDEGTVGQALANFGGVERRFEVLGEAAGVTVVDDYAHHPTEVTATLQAARQVFGSRPLVAAFQPHLYSRTRVFADDFGRVLAGADRVFVTRIYAAREEPIAGVSAKRIVDVARAARGHDRVSYAEDLTDLIAMLKSELRAGDVLLTIGAGDIWRVGPAVLAELSRSHVDA